MTDQPSQDNTLILVFLYVGNQVFETCGPYGTMEDAERAKREREATGLYDKVEIYAED